MWMQIDNKGHIALPEGDSRLGGWIGLPLLVILVRFNSSLLGVEGVVEDSNSLSSCSAALLNSSTALSMASESGFLFFGGDLIATTVDMLETGVISVAAIGRAAISSTFDTSSRPNDKERSYAN